jgi:uncharacterized protein YutD
MEKMHGKFKKKNKDKLQYLSRNSMGELKRFLCGWGCGSFAIEKITKAKSIEGAQLIALY